MNVNNGRLVELKLNGYFGSAGYIERKDHDELSFAATLKSVRAEVGGSVLVDGVPRTITKKASSAFVRGFVVLELAK